MTYRLEWINYDNLLECLSKLPSNSDTNVIFKIKCKECDINQTSKTLIIRVNEHKNHIRWNIIQRSVTMEHRLEMLHEFNWENVKVLRMKKRFYKRDWFSEMLHIKQQANGLNLQNDTVLLALLYFNILWLVASLSSAILYVSIDVYHEDFC